MSDSTLIVSVALRQYQKIGGFGGLASGSYRLVSELRGRGIPAGSEFAGKMPVLGLKRAAPLAR